MKVECLRASLHHFRAGSMCGSFILKSVCHEWALPRRAQPEDGGAGTTALQGPARAHQHDDRRRLISSSLSMSSSS